MKKFRIFILLPSENSSGPVKGAFALANNLVTITNVCIIFIKKGNKINDYLDPKIKKIYLKGKSSNFIKKIINLRKFLRNFKQEELVTISFCFSADIINIFCKDLSYSISSVRGNLFKNYYFDYGIKGIIAAFFHILMLNFIDIVISMSNNMKNQIDKYLINKTIIIPNFIDEKQIKPFFKPKIDQNNNIFKFIFIGNLSSRKQPLLLIKAIEKLHYKFSVFLDIIGDGEKIEELKKYVIKNKLDNIVIFHGHKENPFDLLSKADVFVLPSKSEGISRASLESLFLGIPIVIRGVDSNYLLLEKSNSGSLFYNDEDLDSIMIKIANISKSREKRECLLPDKFRETNIKDIYKNVIFNLINYK